MTNKDALAKHLREDEGLKLEAYIEPISGKWHIGHGHLLDQDQTDAELEIMNIDEEPEDWQGFVITQEKAEALLYQDIKDAIDSLSPTWSEDDLEALDAERFIALISMAFQMGGYKIQKGFPSFVDAVQSEDWDRAADEMMWRNGLLKQKRSAWYRQTPKRCQEMADRMRNGSTEQVSEGYQMTSHPIGPDATDLSHVSDAELIAELSKRLGVSYNGQI